MFLQIAMAMLGTLSFAILFQVPPRQYLLCAASGAVGWVVYLLLKDTSLVLAVFAAALMLTLLSRGLSVVRRVPTAIFLISGIFPLVPGAGIYYTVYHFIMNEMALASLKGVETLKLAGAIVLGILFGFSLPQFLFSKLAVFCRVGAGKGEG